MFLLILMNHRFIWTFLTRASSFSSSSTAKGCQIKRTEMLPLFGRRPMMVLDADLIIAYLWRSNFFWLVPLGNQFNPSYMNPSTQPAHTQPSTPQPQKHVSHMGAYKQVLTSAQTPPGRCPKKSRVGVPP